MTLYARHVMLWVASGALLVPHWFPVLRSPGEGPLEYLGSLALAALVVLGWGITTNRCERRPGHAHS